MPEPYHQSGQPLEAKACCSRPAAGAGALGRRKSEALQGPQRHGISNKEATVVIIIVLSIMDLTTHW